MSTDLALTEQQVTDLQNKQTAFAKFYELAYRTEISLANKVKIGEINLPTNIDELPGAESRLLEIKKLQQDIKAERSVITKKLDELGGRFMTYEKELQPAIDQLTTGIITVKKAHEAAQAEIRQKQQAIQAFREHVVSVRIANDSQFKQIIQVAVNKAYQDALNGEVTSMDQLESYLQKVCERVTTGSFIGRNFTAASSMLSKDEIESIIGELYTIAVEDYVTLFAIELENRFSDYEVALHNKQQALAIANREALDATVEIIKEAESAQLEVDIQSAMIFDTVPDTFVKPLKKSYAIDMDDTMQNALKIMAAFSGNINLCLPKLKITKWMAFTPAQAGTALAKVKCDDNNFTPAGIIFKEVDKL